MEPTPFAYRDFKPADRYFREARLAYYQGGIDLFRQNYYLAIQYGAHDVFYNQKNLVCYFLPDAFSVDKTEQPLPNIRAFLLSERLSMMTFGAISPRRPVLP